MVYATLPNTTGQIAFVHVRTKHLAAQDSCPDPNLQRRLMLTAALLQSASQTPAEQMLCPCLAGVLAGVHSVRQLH